MNKKGEPVKAFGSTWDPVAIEREVGEALCMLQIIGTKRGTRGEDQAIPRH